MRHLLLGFFVLGCFSAQASTIRCALVSNLINAKDYTVRQLDETNPSHRYTKDLVLGPDQSSSNLLLETKQLSDSQVEELHLSIFRDTFNDEIIAGIFRVRRSPNGRSSNPEAVMSFDENSGPVSLRLSKILQAGALDLEEEILAVSEKVVQKSKGLSSSKKKNAVMLNEMLKEIAKDVQASRSSQWLRINGENSWDMNMVCRRD